jgi:hypothetical protein
MSQSRHAKQNARDNAKLIARRERNAAIYPQMVELCKPFREEQLILEAALFTYDEQRRGHDAPPPLDRLARRRRDCLICWLCENHSGVLATGKFVSDMHFYERTIYRSNQSEHHAQSRPPLPPSDHDEPWTDPDDRENDLLPDSAFGGD